MRCQKVRSYLSAYCNDELIGNKKLSVDTHLAGCAACRNEEALYRLLNESTTEIPSMKVSNDFNNKLLNRIGQERFAETRTKAYLPANPPMFAWNKVVPAFVSAALVIITAVALISSQNYFTDTPVNMADVDISADDAYLYAQPTNNPNVTTNLAADWSFDEEFARTQRINNMTRDITGNTPFVHNVSLKTQKASQQMPYLPDYGQLPPMIRIYIVPHPQNGKGGTGDY